MPSFQAGDGTRLAYRVDGQGLAVLALAGFTRDSRDFDDLARHLPGDVQLIRLDSRGRGASGWADPASYCVAQEARDALALLDHLGVARAGIIGSSRGGLLGLVIAATARHRLLGLCLNDVGPVLERAGLLRIGRDVGVAPAVATLAEMAARLPSVMPGFDGVPPLRWQQEAARRCVQREGGLGLTYDPALRQAFDAAMAAPVADLWPLFDACAGLPLALIRGAGSDVLARATARQMRRRRPDMLHAEVPGRGHVPFLDEAEALATIRAWIDRLGPAGPAGRGAVGALPPNPRSRRQ